MGRRYPTHDTPGVDEEIYLDVRTSHGKMRSPGAQLDSFIEYVSSAPDHIK